MEQIDAGNLESAVAEQPEMPASVTPTESATPMPETAPIPTETPAAPMPPIAEGDNTPQMNPEEEIGFHKGAINTLVAERNELVKMIGNVEAIMNAHATRLKELGVELK